MTNPKYQNDEFECMMLKQLNKQELAQLQHQRNICEIIFSTMSSAEKVALKLYENKEYKKYDPMNSSSFKNEIQLENELANKLVYLRGGLIAYGIQHKSFKFPNDNIKKEMINDLDKWSGLIKNRPKALESYKILKKLIEGEIVKIPNNCFHTTNYHANEESTLEWADGMMRTKKFLENQDQVIKNDYENIGTHNVPFLKEKANEEIPYNFNLLYNKYLEDEKNMENYLNILINKIKSKENIVNAEYKPLDQLILQFEASIAQIPQEKMHLSEKMEKYQNLIKDITPKCLENSNYSNIVKYSSKIKEIYYNNLNKSG
jgi:hypothetical protein